MIRLIRTKYACPCCETGVKTASLPEQPIPKSIASPGPLAHVAVSNYQNALPLYRPEQILKRIGVELPRANLAHWMSRLGALVQPLIKLLRDTLLGYDIIQMYETALQVLKEPGKRSTSKSCMWVQKGGPPDNPLILYDYDPSRSQNVPLRLRADLRIWLDQALLGTPPIIDNNPAERTIRHRTKKVVILWYCQ